MIQFLKDIYNGFKGAKTGRKIFYSSLILIYLILILLVTVKVNVEAITPGGININIATDEFDNPNVSVYIETDNLPGNIYTVGVRTHKRISLYQYLIGSLNKDINFEDYDPKTGLTSSEDIAIGKKSKDISIINAIIVAYEEAKKVDASINIDYEFEGILVAFVYEHSKSDLLADDIITHINGEKITPNNIKNELGKITNEDYFEITVIRNNEERKINTRKIYDEVTKRYILGIASMESYKINSDTAYPKFTIKENYSSIGGSGGAMLTLAIYDALTEGDITNGITIIGTGTITVKDQNDNLGIVGDIAGVSQKIVTAQLNNADVFFCNPEDYEEANQKAIEIEADFKVIKVEKFSDIIAYLKGEANE